MSYTRAERLRSLPRTGRPVLQLVKPPQATHPGFDRWPEMGEIGIQSADAAAAIGLDPFKSPVRLWMEKTGRQGLLQPTEVPDDSLSYWGRLLEPIVAAHYTLRTGRKVCRLDVTLRHPLHSWMLSAPGREVVGALDVQYLECLSVGMNAAHLWQHGIPTHVRVRAVHQLAVTGKHAMDMVVLICGQDLQVHRVERDEAEIERLIDRERAFWRCVECDQAPPVNEKAWADASSSTLRSRAAPACSLQHPSETPTSTGKHTP